MHKLARILAFLAAGAAFAASPPALVNYQGVLRDAGDQPLSGSYDMTFRFFDAATAGNEILADHHLALGTGAVTVVAGLFDVVLGSGDVTDGSGPGTFTSVAEVFRDHADVWLAMEIEGEVLDPRVRVVAAAYALNSDHLDGLDSSSFLDTSSAAQSKAGPLTVDASAVPSTIGIEAHGPQAGGLFEDSDGSGSAFVGYGNSGIDARGGAYGGHFAHTSGLTGAFLATTSDGISAHGYTTGASADNYQGSTGMLASGVHGVWGRGTAIGGAFYSIDGNASAILAGDNYGIRAFGSYYGGYFQASSLSGATYAGILNSGTEGYGTSQGGYFKDSDNSGQAWVGYGDEGIYSIGSFGGGFFDDTNSSSWVRTGYSTYKVQGSGSVSFVQNHPFDAGKVIVYAAPEGDEVAVYTRGSAKLVDGKAHVALGETFAWTANPDLGLTAHLTPRGAPVPLAVDSLSTVELVVAGPAGADAEFDYIVWGLRLGFEEQSIVQPKRLESPIPAMTDHQGFYAADSSLRDFNARARFLRMEGAVRGTDAVDTTRAEALIAAIGVYDPATSGSVLTLHGIEEHAQPEPPEWPEPHEKRPPDAPSTLGASRPSGEGSAARANPSTPKEPGAPLPAGVERFALSEPVSRGDVLELDPLLPGSLQRARTERSAGVVGIAAESCSAGEGLVVVAQTARVLVDASHGAIRPGALLVTSTTPGAARVAGEGRVDPGTVLGKALEELPAGIGEIRVLLMAR